MKYKVTYTVEAENEEEALNQNLVQLLNVTVRPVQKPRPNPRKMLDRFHKNEEINAHTKNALMVVNAYGTDEEKKEMKAIAKKHMDRGHILKEESDRRYELSHKYYIKLIEAL